ncbi:MAG: class I SAM-dependent methyltransferase [Rhodanobacter sp.]
MADETMVLDSTARFSDRVEDYVRYRPDYPLAIIEWLQQEQGVDLSWQVADIGAGTGISSKMFLDAGYRVTAVEPNAPMRAAAVQWLGGHHGFDAVAGAADATTLDSASIDLVIVAQAFHWFNEAAARREFARILRTQGLVAIWWNSRRLVGTPFLEGYEALLQCHGTDYSRVAERYADDAHMRHWFGERLRGTASFEHSQQLDFDALRGRLMSSSYAPREGHPKHAPMLQALRQLFDRCAELGTVSFDYDTRIFAGQPV